MNAYHSRWLLEKSKTVHFSVIGMVYIFKPSNKIAQNLDKRELLRNEKSVNLGKP